MKNLKYILTIMMVMIISSCFQSEEIYMLNPDGSAKIKVMQRSPINVFGNKKGEQLKQDILSKVRDFLYDAEGVEAWTDFEYEISPDSSRIELRGTAYVPDISKLEGEAFGFSFGHELQDGGDRGKLFVIDKDKKDEPGIEERQEEPLKPVEKMTEEEIEAEIENMKTEYNSFRGMAQMMLGTMEVMTIVDLPGEIVDLNGFQRLNDRSVEFGFKGEKVLKKLDSMTSQEGFWREQVMSGDRLFSDDMEMEKVIQVMFGTSEPPHVVYENDGKMFDYKKEIEKAKMEWSVIKKKHPQE